MQYKTLRNSAEANLISLMHRPMLMGFLSDKYNKDAQFGETDMHDANWFGQSEISQIMVNRAKIREILTSNGRSVIQGALAWLWAMGDQVVPIPGIRTEAQAIENAGVMEFGPFAFSTPNVIIDPK